MNRIEIAEAARAHVGYRALPLKTQPYGVAGRDWNGAFVRRVYRENGVRLSSDSTVQLLTDAVHANALYNNPRIGDIVFYAFPATDSMHGQPHVGIVTDVSRWKTDRSFTAVEGQTESGNPREDQTPNGIYNRVRYHTDVLAFFRVPEKKASGERPTPKVQISVSLVENGKRHKAIESVQLALGATVGLRDAARGLYDARTRSAMAAYQRRLGRVGHEANGLPDGESLKALALETGIYDLKE